MTISNHSFIYSNIYVYRIIMSFLYIGGYKDRFRNVENLLEVDSNSSLNELCFGDIYLAKWCYKNKVNWEGIDINDNFVRFALNQGFSARCINLRGFPKLRKSSVIIIMGSLYHFEDILPMLIDYIMQSCNRFIISEPIKNLSSNPGLLGWIARKSANAGQGDEVFRFSELTLIDKINEISHGRYTIINHGISGKDIILELRWS